MIEERKEWREKTLFSIIILFSLNVMDAIGTTFILSKGGTEINPVALFLFGKIGYNTFILLKLMFPILLGMLVTYVSRHPILFYNKGLKLGFKYGVLILNIVYLFVVFFIAFQLLV